MCVAETDCTVPTVACALPNWRSQGKVRSTRSSKVLLSCLLEGESSTVAWKIETDHGATYGTVNNVGFCHSNTKILNS